MFEEVKAQYLGVSKKIKHQNVKSLSDLKGQLSKAFSLPQSYGIYYQLIGEELCVQNDYDFQALDGTKVIKFIIRSNQQKAVEQKQENIKKNASNERKIQTPLQIISPKGQTKGEVSCQQCENFKNWGFQEVQCVDCQKKNAKLPVKIDKGNNLQVDHKNSKIAKPAVKQIVPIVQQRKEFGANNRQIMVSQAKIQSQAKPFVKIQVKYQQIQNFKQNQRKIKEALNLFTDPQVKKRAQNLKNHKQIGLARIAQLVADYDVNAKNKLQNQGKDFEDKLKYLLDVLGQQRQNEIREFINRNITVPKQELLNLYLQDKY